MHNLLNCRPRRVRLNIETKSTSFQSSVSVSLFSMHVRHIATRSKRNPLLCNMNPAPHDWLILSFSISLKLIVSCIRNHNFKIKFLIKIFSAFNIKCFQLLCVCPSPYLHRLHIVEYVFSVRSFEKMFILDFRFSLLSHKKIK